MKKSIYTLAVLVLASTFAVQAVAETKTRRTEVTTTTTTDGGSRIGVGYTTYRDAFSVWVDLSHKLSLQPFLTVASSDPFNFAFGSILRVKVHGNDWSGFHVGGGFDLGTAGATKEFFLNIFPIAGFAFNVGNNVGLSFDGGPMFHVTPSPFNFSLGALSTHAGASIHYFF